MSLLSTCHTPLLTTGPTTTILEACQMLVEAKLGAIAIIENGALVGIFTERDAVQKVVLNAINPGDTPISQVMSSPVITIPQDRSPHDAIALLKRNSIRHVIVTTNGPASEPIGLLSYRLLLANTIENLNADIDSMSAYMGSDGIGGD